MGCPVLESNVRQATDTEKLGQRVDSPAVTQVTDHTDREGLVLLRSTGSWCSRARLGQVQVNVELVTHRVEVQQSLCGVLTNAIPRVDDGLAYVRHNLLKTSLLGMPQDTDIDVRLKAAYRIL